MPRVDDPSSIPRRNVWANFAMEVRRHRGEWRTETASSSAAARQAATRLRGSHPALAEIGEFEVVRDGSTVYARLIVSDGDS